jgi:hypothetical protein
MLTMKNLRRLALATALLIPIAWGGSASAAGIILSLDSIDIVGAQFDVVQTTTPATPIGLGDIDLGLGTGTLKMLNYTTHLDVAANGVGIDADLDIRAWTQLVSSIDVVGNVTSTGSGGVFCTDFNLIGGFVCDAIPPGGVAGWPPADGTLLPSSAVLDQLLQTITVIDNSNATAGTVTTSYSYTFAPEPSTGLLTALGLVGFSVVSRRRKA